MLPGQPEQAQARPAGDTALVDRASGCRAPARRSTRDRSESPSPRSPYPPRVPHRRRTAPSHRRRPPHGRGAARHAAVGASRGSSPRASPARPSGRPAATPSTREEAGLRPASRCSSSSSPPAASSSCARSPPAAHLQGQRDRDLDTLERRRLVGRRRLEHDRRAAVVAITPPGQELVERLFPEHSSCVARAFAPLDDDEKRTLVELCRKLAAT